jgi:hypothetical protein
LHPTGAAPKRRYWKLKADVVWRGQRITTHNPGLLPVYCVPELL